MNRMAAKRLLPALGWPINGFCKAAYVIPLAADVSKPTLFSTAGGSETPPNRNPNPFDNLNSSSTSASYGQESARERGSRESVRPKSDWQEERARVLQASLSHVVALGWSNAAMIAGARDVGVSPSIVGSFSQKEASLVEYFMDDCLQRLIDLVDGSEDLKNLIPSQHVAKLATFRLEMQAPYISKWPQALSIQAQPINISTSFKQRAMLIDEIWHAAGDEASNIDWHAKRTVLGGIYTATELYMLTDTSPDFQNTWTFLEDRIKDAFDLRNTVQEAKYFAEAVGTGMGGSIEGFVKRMFQS